MQLTAVQCLVVLGYQYEPFEYATIITDGCSFGSHAVHHYVPSITLLGTRMGLSTPMVDRPYLEYSSSSERTTKRVIRGAGIRPARSSHALYQKSWR